MPSRIPRLRAAATPVAAALLAMAGALLAVWARAGATADRLSALSIAGTIIFIGITGCVLALARPDNRVGRLMVTAAAVWGIGEGCFDTGVRGIVTAPGSVPAATAFAVVGAPLAAVGWLGLVAVPVLFPTGRLPGRRWRWLGWTAVAAIGVTLVGTALAPDLEQTVLHTANWRNPLAPPPPLRGLGDGLGTLALPLMAAVIIGGVAALVARWRHGDARVRRQLLTFAAGAAAPIAVIPTSFGTGSPPWVFALALTPLPLAAAVAIMTGGAFDAATVANRSLVWLTLSAAIVGIYVLVVAGTGELLGSAGARWLPWLGAGVVAVSFSPLRSALSEAANRITYGKWRRPYDVLAGLTPRIEAAADANRALADVVAEIEADLGLSGVVLRNANREVVAGRGAGGTVVIPLRAYGRLAGELSFGEPVTPLRPTDRRVLDDLAAQLAVLMHARALTDDLQRARERLVLAREEERRRLRRDLHDGLGPALAGLMLKLDNARALVPDDPSGAERDLLLLRDDVRSTVLDVRRLVEGLRPPALDELGLGPALAQAAARLGSRTGLSIDVDVDDPLGSLPAAVEVALYRIVSEAVTNVIRHSGASSCRVSVAVRDGTAIASVSDDGAGIRPDRMTDDRFAIAEDGAGVNVAHGSSGTGLINMRERAAELGGTLEIATGGPGCTVTAMLPLPAVAPTGVAA